MSLKPCLDCGTPADGPRCDEHTVDKRAPKPKSHVHANRGQWKALSAKARRQQPWCSRCHTGSDLTADHIIPFSTCPELAHAIENLDVLCRSCNGKRGNRFTPEEARAVLTRLQGNYNRRPTKQGRERIDAAQRAIQTWGEAPTASALHPLPRQSLGMRS